MKTLDVRSTEDIPALMDMFDKKDNVVVLVYADYCGHCHTYRDEVWNGLNGSNMAAVHYDQVDKLQTTPLKDTTIAGYPTVLYVEKGKAPVEVENPRDLEKMNTMLEPGSSNEESDSDSDSDSEVESNLESTSLNLDNRSSEKRRKSVLKSSKVLPKKPKEILKPKISALPPNSTEDMLNSQMKGGQMNYNNDDDNVDSVANSQTGGSLYNYLLDSIKPKARKSKKTSKNRKTRLSKKRRNTRRK
jgi:hypothetical protein